MFDRKKLQEAQAEFSEAQIAEARARVYKNHTLQSQDAAAVKRLERAQVELDRIMDEART